MKLVPITMSLFLNGIISMISPAPPSVNAPVKS